MKKTYVKLLMIERDARKPFLIFVYFLGHGVTESGKQIFLLNNSDPREVIFNCEYKMRKLANIQGTKAHVCCVFDCCRVPLGNMNGLD